MRDQAKVYLRQVRSAAGRALVQFEEAENVLEEVTENKDAIDEALKNSGEAIRKAKNANVAAQKAGDKAKALLNQAKICK